MARLAGTEELSRGSHPFADRLDQSLRGQKYDVHDRQGGGEPSGIIVSDLDDRAIVRDRELRPRDADVRVRARLDDILRRDLLQKLNRQASEAVGYKGTKRRRHVRDDDAIGMMSVDEGAQNLRSTRLRDHRMRLSLQVAKGHHESA